MGNDIADFNNDGQLDIVTADMLPGNEKTLKTYGNGEHLNTYYQRSPETGTRINIQKTACRKIMVTG